MCDADKAVAVNPWNGTPAEAGVPFGHAGLIPETKVRDCEGSIRRGRRLQD
jgi:hypothetical protein